MSKLLWAVAGLLLVVAGVAIWKFSPAPPSFSEILKLKDSLFSKADDKGNEEKEGGQEKGGATSEEAGSNGDASGGPSGIPIGDSTIPPADIFGTETEDSKEAEFSVEIIDTGGGAGVDGAASQ